LLRLAFIDISLSQLGSRLLVFSILNFLSEPCQVSVSTHSLDAIFLDPRLSVMLRLYPDHTSYKQQPNMQSIFRIQMGGLMLHVDDT
jgi:hypothetical protein